MDSKQSEGSERSMHEMVRSIFSVRMVVAFAMGFACGLPLLLTISLLQAWMSDAGVDLGTIGLFALVGLPYTLKFLWAPIFDRFTLKLFGRRRGWLLLAQLLLMVAIATLGMVNPVEQPWLLAFVALLVTFFSASQDIVVDAYRREDLRDEELGLGSSLYVNGYRIGMLLAGSGGLILADHVSFQTVYLIMAATMLIAVVTTLLAREPVEAEGTPKTLREAVIDPFVDYFQRPEALWILAFILFYKVGDTMASAMTMPFYLEIGFSKTEVGAVAKLFGFWATIIGGLVGGVMILRLGIFRSLWLFGFLQAISTAGFSVLALMGNSLSGLAAVIAFENFSGGMGTAAYVAFMASMTNKRFTATQYALLSSLMGIPRVIASAPTGYLAEGVGWFSFFIVCTLIAIPGLWILRRFSPERNGLMVEARAL
ncbi:AmpG family muropeptide MFS transporter [Solemya pervernicosa gill symbiont]|uniref:AmpG family muropeptide MFS transporter n=3 Tax=Gammaproteobacteria incertae sedis TaxID=118884 RepID=A0A1T2L463_9GAMM|nr:AmpG family muropeptide MFS transporter [Solemya pervernicosa gill symbiont]QKQ28171.1 AmpG family muropeptide MFS transporter [Candidatus Reidiella endopervernicosa]